MRRREFLAAFVGTITQWPLVARAQQSHGMRLISVLMGPAENDPAAQLWLAAFRDGLTKLGWTADSNLRIELRWGGLMLIRSRHLQKS